MAEYQSELCFIIYVPVIASKYKPIYLFHTILFCFVEKRKKLHFISMMHGLYVWICLNRRWGSINNVSRFIHSNVIGGKITMDNSSCEW